MVLVPAEASQIEIPLGMDHKIRLGRPRALTDPPSRLDSDSVARPPDRHDPPDNESERRRTARVNFEGEGRSQEKDRRGLMHGEDLCRLARLGMR
ncbi:hypothetical protein FA13DRAFT_1731201, partial [Coprinellus micaceus]